MSVIPWGTDVRRRGQSLVTYAHGAGGRICDLPGHYLDMVAEAIIHGHPKYVRRSVRELLVTGKFVRSVHPQLRDLTLAELRAQFADRAKDQYRRRLEMYPNLNRDRARRRRELRYVIR